MTTHMSYYTLTTSFGSRDHVSLDEIVCFLNLVECLMQISMPESILREHEGTHNLSPLCHTGRPTADSQPL